VNRLFGQIKSSVIARNTLWMSLGHGFRLVVQVVYFIIIARSLGAQGYGAFVSVAALVAILSPFSGWGASHLLVRDVSRDANAFRQRWGDALVRCLASGSILVGVVLLISGYVLPDSVPLLLVLLVAVSDLLFARIVDTSGFAFLAFQRLGWTAQLQVSLSLTRLGAALILVLLAASPTPLQWGFLYLLSTTVSALVGLWLVNKKLGPPKIKLVGIASELREGFYFSLSTSSQNANNDIDKTMLAQFSTLEATGIYAAAYRLIQVTFTPIRALGYASYARFFQHGSAGIEGSLGFARRLILYAAAYGLTVGLALYLIAPLLPYVLGADYQNAVGAVRWLALLPLFKALQYFAADTLTGAGFQGIRSSVQVSVVLFNVLINLLLIPSYSWLGAAWASLASDALLLLGLWASVWYLHRKGQDRAAQTSP
jgi:O-antigen/teichoic acid export membrane protein